MSGKQCKHTGKRTLGLLLAMLMILQVAPMQVFASNYQQDWVGIFDSFFEEVFHSLFEEGYEIDRPAIDDDYDYKDVSNDDIFDEDGDKDELEADEISNENNTSNDREHTYDDDYIPGLDEWYQWLRENEPEGGFPIHWGDGNSVNMGSPSSNGISRLLDSFVGVDSLNASVTRRYTVLVLDVSGSMAGMPIQHLRIGSQRFVDQVLEAAGVNNVAIVAFGTTATIRTGFTDDPIILRNAINGLNAGGSTAMHGGLLLAEQLLQNIPDEPNVIKNVLLLSDGLPNVGATSTQGPFAAPQPSWQFANAVYHTAQRIMGRGYNMYSLAFFHNISGSTLAFASYFKSRLHNLGFHVVDNANDLYFVFDDIANNIARRLTGDFNFSSPRDQSNMPFPMDFSARFFWDEDYFARPAQEHNPSLATMSLAFVMSAFGSSVGGTHDYSDKSRNARDLLGRLGFGDIETNQYFTQRPHMDSMGVIAGHRDIMVNGNDYTLIALSTRGGGYEAEWASNLTMGSHGYHAGFNTAATETLGFLRNYISRHESEFQDNIKIWIVGFSRGAATANLVASWLSRWPNHSGVRIDRENIYAYLFATPRNTVSPVGFATDAAMFGNIHNTVFQADPVVHVAPEAWGFERYGTEHNLPELHEMSIFVDYNQMMGFFQELMGNWADYYITREVENFIGVPFHITDTFARWRWRQLFWEGISFADYNMVLDRSTPASVFLRDHLVSSLANSLGSRALYEMIIENFAREVMGGLMGSENPEQWRLGFGLFVDRIFEFDHMFILVNAVFNPFSNIEMLPDTLAALLIISLVDAGVDVSTLHGMSQEAFRYAVAAFIDLLFFSDFSIPDLRTTIDQIGTLFTAHYPELYMAWLMQRDPLFNGGVNTASFTPAIRIIRIASPVDVHVYDTDTGRLMVQIIDNEPQSIESHLIFSVNAEGEKIMYLPADGNYEMILNATADGAVSVVIAERCNIIRGYSRITSWFDIPVTYGDVLTSSIPAFSYEDRNNTWEGSRIPYNLNNGSQDLTPDRELSGEEAEQARHRITLESSNPATGRTIGGGNYVNGSFAVVVAITAEDEDFLGWYIGNQRVYSESIYRFRVLEDAHLVARFTGTSQPQPPTPPPSGGNQGGVSNQNDGRYEPNNPITTPPTTQPQPPPQASPPTQTPNFIDINPADWFFDYINFVYSQGLMTGTGTYPMLFSPDMPLTRAMLVTILHRHQNLPSITEGAAPTNPFNDVTQNTWYTDAVIWTYTQGIILGYGNGNFGPHDNITRQDLSVILTRYADITGIEIPITRDFINFQDETYIAGYAQDAVRRLFMTGIINGRPNNIFDPRGMATRAEVAAVLYRFLNIDTQ